MEFDKNGCLKAQKINQKISHEIDHDRLYKELPLIKRKLSKEKYNSLLEFVHDYMQTHVFVSRIMVSGLYITKRNPKQYFINDEVFRKAINKKISLIIDVYKKLGVCERYGKNVVKIDGNKLKQFSLDDIKEYCFKN